MRLGERDRQLLRIVAVLLAIYLGMAVFAQVWQAVGAVADVLLIFVAAWAVSYLLSPLVTRIDQSTILNRTLSVVVVYIGIAFVLAGTLALVVPGLVSNEFHDHAIGGTVPLPPAPVQGTPAGQFPAAQTVDEVVTGPVLSRLYGGDIQVIHSDGHIFVLSKGRNVERVDHLPDDLQQQRVERPNNA